MNNLFAAGFNLTEIVDFLARSKLTEPVFVAKMRQGLASGQGLSQILADLQFSEQVVTQVALADYHGNIAETLQLVEHNLRRLSKVRKKLVSVATYPLILLSFLVLIMLGMKNYLLPQINSSGGQNFATAIISNLPMVFLSTLLMSAGLTLGLRWFFKRRSALRNQQQLARLPFIGRFVRAYWTAYFAREWGLLLSQGLDFQTMLTVMPATGDRIFGEAAKRLLGKMKSGSEFHAEVQDLKIFNDELSLIIEYGQMKAKLGTELAVYSDECWETFFTKLERAMQLIQPLVFLFVALAIVLIYAAMLLPIYQNIDMKF